jgi:FAD:protein FMN transferase
MTELQFRAMGSDAHVIVVGGPDDLAELARARIDDLEQRWSRFVAASEVNELNRRAGTAVPVSAETVMLVRHAVEAWRLTGGSFDPTVLGDVIRAGYDRTFDDVADHAASGTSALMTGCSDIVVTDDADGGAGRVELPAGIGFDPGGIGKGLAADVVVDEVAAAGARGVCINLGGDLRLFGESPTGDAWTVAVEHPWSTEPVVNLGLHDGAVATSTTLRRRWEVDGETRHHLIDPGTGRPATTDLTLATVVAGRAWVAEVLAKAVLLRGLPHQFDLIGGTGAEALVVDDTGHVHLSSGLAAFTGGVSPQSIPVPSEATP